MAKVLTKQQLISLNDRMLQRGAPTEIDNTGYNKFDWGVMDNISPEQPNFCFVVAKTLKKYTKTQIPEIRDVIDATIESYKPTRTVTAVTHDSFGIGVEASYCAEWVEYLKGLPKGQKHRWEKQSNKFILFLAYDALGELTEKLESFGFDPVQVREYAELEAQTDPIESSVHIECSRIDVDNLKLQFEYHKGISDILKTTKTAHWDKDGKHWTVDLSQIYGFCKAIKAAGIKVSSDTLKEWCLKMKHTSSYTLQNFDLSHMKWQPRPYQIEDAKVMLASKRIINANEMGCGKTFECVIAGASIKGSKVVICPPTLRINWEREIHMAFPNASVEIIRNADEPKLTAEWTIMGYPSVTKHLNSLVSQDIAALFVDEAQYIQALNNYGKPNSDRAKAVLYLAKTIEYVIPVTGTPKTNRNKNLFNILKLVEHPLTQGQWSFRNYSKTYCDGQNNGYGWDYEGNSNDDQLHEKIKSSMVRHLKRDVMPGIIKQRIPLPVEVNLREYHRLIDEYLKGRENKEAEQLARLMKARHVLSTQKAPESIELAKTMVESGEKVIIVTSFLDTLDSIKKAFKGNCVAIQGGMSDKQKDAAVQEFQDGKAMVCALQIIAGGVGLTLTASHNMIINDFDWTPGNIVQVEDRIARGGQTADCSNIFFVYANGADMDEIFIETLDVKMDSINDAIDGGTADTFDIRRLVDNALALREQGIDWRKSLDALFTAKPKRTKALKSVGGNAVQAVPAEPKTKVENAETNTVNYSSLTIEELEALADSKGVVYKKYENAGIYRMRLIMTLKKAA